MNSGPETKIVGNATTRKSMSDWAAVKATLKAAIEANDRLDVSIRQSEKMGALPPNLMSGQRDLYQARKLLAAAISHLKKSSPLGR